MITDKELGLKIAENEEEEFWENTRQQAEKVANELIPEQISKLHREQKLNNAIKEMAENKLKELQKQNI